MGVGRTSLETAALLGGAAALGYALARRPRPARAAAPPDGATHRVVVVGAGFAGLEAARRLAGAPGLSVTVIDRRNHHLFQPLLYQVATAALSSAEIATPVRAVLGHDPNVEVRLDEVTGLDLANRTVIARGGLLPYDTLILATGSETSWFGHDDWTRGAVGLKDLDDAMALRRRILLAFERAERSEDPAERARLMTFVLVGGGPTGVEMAGAVAELAHRTLAGEYHHLDTRRARILLVEAGPRILAAFPRDLADRAARDLTGMGVEIRTHTPVTGIGDGVVRLGGEELPAETIVWAAGVRSTPVAQWLGVKPGHDGGVAVGPDLALPDHPEIFVLGDAALAPAKDGGTLPWLAAVAKQQGAYAAHAVRARVRGAPVPPFRYRDWGTLATIGRNRAVADLGWARFAGFPAWLFWAVAHIFFLIGFRNRVLVSVQWAFAYATAEHGARVVAGPEGRGHDPADPVPRGA